MPILSFYIQWDLQVTLCISVRPCRETLTHYFSCLCGTSTDSKNSVMGHVMPNLCFYNRCDLWVT
jgi:hypothetical protein